MDVYCKCQPIIDTEYGGEDDQSPSEVIIDAVAAAAGVDPLELPPLYESVDPDAIDALFERHDGAKDAKSLLRFKIDTWNVFVRADGHIRVCDATCRIEPRPVFESNIA